MSSDMSTNSNSIDSAYSIGSIVSSIDKTRNSIEYRIHIPS
jgi:hypothetical protein